MIKIGWDKIENVIYPYKFRILPIFIDVSPFCLNCECHGKIIYLEKNEIK